MIDIENLGKDFVKDAVAFAAESKSWREKYNAEYKRNLDLGEALTNMFFCFRCLTTDGGWNSMTEAEKQTMIKYRDKARQVWLGS
jgi:hypothetical protein